MRPITVIPPGSRVGLRVPEIPDALVLESSVGIGGVVTYRVAWWVGAERKVDWVFAAEVTADPPDRVTIGFGK